MLSSLDISSWALERTEGNKGQSQKGTKKKVNIYRHACLLTELQIVLSRFYYLVNGFHMEIDKVG